MVLLAYSLPAQEMTYKVIVHPDNPVSSMSKKQVSNLLLKKVTKWADGKDVLPLDLANGSEARKNLSKDIHKKKVASVKVYWKKLIFSGRKIPPPEKKSDRDVLAFVQKYPGAIGYISTSTDQAEYKVKELKIQNY